MSIPAVTVHAIIRNQQEARNEAPLPRVEPKEYVFTPRPAVKKKHGRRAKQDFFKTNWSKVFRLQWF
jgi:hypothetical protein